MSSRLKRYLVHFPISVSKFFHKKISYLFLKRSCSEKVSYIFSKKAFLIFGKQNFLIFEETYIQNPGIFRNRSIFRTLVYSERREIQNIIKHLQLNVLQNSYLAHFLSPSLKNERSSYISLYFRKSNFLALILRNFLYFLKRKLFLYFGTQKPRKNSLYFRKRNFIKFEEVNFKLEKEKIPL